MPTIAIHTLGCKVNQYDSQIILAKFRALGFFEVDFSAFADLYLINSCSVTHVAEHKSRQFVAKVLKRNPQAQIIVAGCYSRLDAEKVQRIPGVTGIIQNPETLEPLDLDQLLIKLNLVQQPDIGMHTVPLRRIPTPSQDPSRLRIRRNLVIQTGCEEFCAYCIIPYARGKLWSKPFEQILAEAEHIVTSEGAKELILTGINLGSYSWYSDSDQKSYNLIKVINEICQIAGLLRLRISSIEPQYWSQELLDCIATNPKVCQHFHIPLQSGCDKVLAQMNRKYTTKEYQLLVYKIMNMFPEAAITTDLITGFPGETEEDHLETCQYIEQLGFAQAHCFKFSARKGTPAAEMSEQISSVILKTRMDKLQDLCHQIAKNYQVKFTGKASEVLWESYDQKNQMLVGLTDNYLRTTKVGSWNKLGELEIVLLD